MTEWTPELAKFIDRFADYEEKQIKDRINPRTSARGTALRIIFRHKTKAGPVYKKICNKMGFAPDLDQAGFARNLQKIADLAKLNNSPAADKLERVLAAEQKVAAIFEEKRAGNAQSWEAAKKVKQANIQY